MVIVSVCVGSSCHLTGSEEIVEMLTKAIKEKDVEDEVVLMGSFCFGKCNRKGVTIGVDDDVFPGITPEGFPQFFEEQIMKRID
ncbi:MAG: (2Fe-2S) ferredoxin domain-containing protein [Blautia sp.]|nr:(2Fe-2S) ferredoxin domain-containing protein [Blautia sp.]